MEQECGGGQTQQHSFDLKDQNPGGTSYITANACCTSHRVC